MRYSVVEVTLDKDHPQFPNQTLFYLWDGFKKQRSLGCYTNRETADGWANKLNFK